jgi:hypothetical protein
MNVDKKPAYPAAVERLKAEGPSLDVFACGSVNTLTI